jgi:hypothetical protein
MWTVAISLMLSNAEFSMAWRWAAVWLSAPSNFRAGACAGRTRERIWLLVAVKSVEALATFLRLYR